MPSRVVLITGPTGSGKTTTVYSAINRINDPLGLSDVYLAKLEIHLEDAGMLAA